MLTEHVYHGNILSSSRCGAKASAGPPESLARGFFSGQWNYETTVRVIFLIDGFNLYHSIRDVIDEKLGGPHLKWLDIQGMCGQILRDSEGIPTTARVSGVRYFSALAKHMEAQYPGTVKRHEAFIEAQQVQGTTVHLAEFKKKGKGRHVEKETDVAIAVALLEFFHNDEADCVFIMSGDTDIMPALRAAHRMYPDRKVGFAFPYKRENNSLKDAADIYFHIRAHHYAKHILPNPVIAAGGREIHCPTEWLPL